MFNEIKTILSKYDYFDNSLLDYTNTLITILAGLFILFLIKKIVLRKIKRIADKTQTTIDDTTINSIKRFFFPVLYFLIFYISIQHLTTHKILHKIITVTGLIIVITNLTRFLISSFFSAIEHFWFKDTQKKKKDSALTAIKSIIVFILWSIALILFLDNLNIKITSLLAGLGITGVAVAFAAQTILKDIFSYFSILIDKPFEVGDFIIIGDFQGSIEHIGVKTTNIRSVNGEQIIVSNNDLTNSRLRNYKRMDERRAVFEISLDYSTTSEQLSQVPHLIKKIIGPLPETRFDNSYFKSYSKYGLIIETTYYILNKDFKLYTQTQETINIKVKKIFDENQIKFAPAIISQYSSHFDANLLK